MSVSGGPDIVENGLVLCLDAGNTKSYPGSGTAWTDLSRRGNNGTLTNGPTFNSANGGSIVFDGSNDYATVANTNLGSIGGKMPSCTITCWAYIIKTSSYQHIFGYRNDSNFSFFFLLLDIVNSGQTEARIQTTSGVYDISLDYSSYYNKWVQISFVANGTRTDLYFNGALVGSNTSVAGTFGSTSSNFLIGLNPDLASYPMRGSVGQTLLYNRPLTLSEILQNYNATKGRFRL